MRKKCECGKSNLYGYQTEIGTIFICYACGRFEGKDVHPVLLELATSDPNFIEQLLTSERLD
tara:strand:- start:7284 stop:7469 length:186 start_codon:yes stop_codon:yes gene_type:complete